MEREPKIGELWSHNGDRYLFIRIKTKHSTDGMFYSTKLSEGSRPIYSTKKNDTSVVILDVNLIGILYGV